MIGLCTVTIVSKIESKIGYGGANQHVGIETEGSSSRPISNECEASLGYMRFC